jgi:hypothetical protein
MSDSAFDIFLDHAVDEHYEEDLPPDPYWGDEPEIEPSTDYDNYDGWDDMQ